VQSREAAQRLKPCVGDDQAADVKALELFEASEMNQAGVGDPAGLRERVAEEIPGPLLSQPEMLDIGKLLEGTKPLVGDLRIAQMNPPDAIAVTLDQARQIFVVEINVPAECRCGEPDRE